MKFHLQSLELAFKKEPVVISFSDVSYFWGQMGAGKSSIAKLIDYCLGGDIELSPAMQSEFVSATLSMSLELSDLTLERSRETDRVVATWQRGGETFQAVVPARKPDGEIIPSTGVEVLSDLVFWLSVGPKLRLEQDAARHETTATSVGYLFGIYFGTVI